MGLATEYPSELILICLILGFGYSSILYYLDLKRESKAKVIWAMSLLRFFSVFIISFLILDPLFKQSEKIIEKPIVIIGIDNSRSVVLAGDSDYYRTTFPAQINKLANELKKKCEVKIYSLGENLKNGFSASYTDNQTDISSFFNEVTTRYANRNAAALILATDGIFNKGADPFYAAQKISFPVYTIAIGDTNLKKDACIRKIFVNKTAFKGDKFPVEVLVEINKCAGLNSKLSISQGNRVIETTNIRATNDRYFLKVPFILEAKETGLIKYSLMLGEFEKEVNLQNNKINFYVEVYDKRQKIALVFDSPHPDIRAIQKAFEGSSHFEIDLINADSLPKSFDKYDLIILNQLPSISRGSDLTSFTNCKASLLYIIGSQTDINAFNKLKQFLIINSSKNSFTESQPVINENFSLFSITKNHASIFSESPPLQSPFGVYQVSPLAEILFYQKIGTVSTTTPMIMFTRVSEKKIGIIAGENIWRWRMYNYIQQSNYEAFDLLIDKIAQYLCTKDDKDFFRIRTKSKISENEPVEIDAEVYNGTYELINDPEVNITINDVAGKTYSFVFSKTLKSYYLNAGLFPAGEYSFRATTKVGFEKYQKSGKFIIEQVNIESSNLVADHHLLFRIANAHDGEMISRDSIAILTDKITSRQDIRSVSIYQNRMTGLIGNPLLFSIILVLLTAEWVIRKREGK